MLLGSRSILWDLGVMVLPWLPAQTAPGCVIAARPPDQTAPAAYGSPRRVVQDKAHILPYLPSNLILT